MFFVIELCTTGHQPSNSNWIDQCFAGNNKHPQCNQKSNENSASQAIFFSVLQVNGPVGRRSCMLARVYVIFGSLLGLCCAANTVHVSWWWCWPCSYRIINSWPVYKCLLFFLSVLLCLYYIFCYFFYPFIRETQSKKKRKTNKHWKIFTVLCILSIRFEIHYIEIVPDRMKPFLNFYFYLHLLLLLFCSSSVRVV